MKRSKQVSGGGSEHGQGVQFVPFKTSTVSLRLLLLHGNLDIWVKEARNLPNMDLIHKNLGEVFGKIFSKRPSKITSDPYVTVAVSGAAIGKTFVISNTENPVWRQHFNVPVAHYGAEVHFVVKDSDLVGSELMGAVGIPVEEIISGALVQGTYPIIGPNGKECNPGAALSLSIQYIPIANVPLYHGGVGADHSYRGVPDTYFPLRRGGTLKLYQDAHTHEGLLPNVLLANGRLYQHGHCWRDIFDAISQARRLIYITGWSVNHLVRLVRDDPNVRNSTLGEILKLKSQEGVRVLLLVWDDPTSRSILGYKTETGTIYTHHQKSVIVDADAPNNRRKIISFIGGLDLCDGRYDTPKHPLFSTLQTVHRDDYHNANYTGPAVGCPREPWHDLHCKIDGPAAYDVLTNFEERWLKASKRHGLRKMRASHDDSLLRLERIPDILGIAEAASQREDDPEGWHVQVFRSIDSNSVKGFPKDPKEASSRNLVCGKNVLIDMGIHTAYVKAIRAAQHFIYFENQYFVGSSYNWDNYKDQGANNLIPMEIALKIANKIRSRERFSVYIIIPMWPEGAPAGKSTQRILFWQYNTMQMMYETIYKALEEMGLEKEYEPQDYLNFFCLRNREAEDSGSKLGTIAQAKILHKKNRRFMIYVHSKGMIVDDEFVLIGSANINQRSLDGTRDTEIAMGAYQPHYTWATKHANPHGQMLLLHGNLDIWVTEAKNLPNMDFFHNMADMFGRLSGKFLGATPVKITSDPYVTIAVSGAVIGRTFVISNTEDPVWIQHFHVPVAHYGAEVQFVVKDSDVVGSQFMGSVGISVEQLLLGAPITGTYPIIGANGKPCNPGAVLTLSIQYIPVGADHSCEGVSGTYFPVRRGGNVTLYQDAHAHDESLPKLGLANGRVYRHGNCWRDIFDAISLARRLIYITGWSVNHLVKLVRDDPNVENSTLGEILKVKSQEGVRVLLLVSDDPTSTNILGFKTNGVVGTSEEETRRYFQDSSVQVLLCPRTAEKGSWAKKQETGKIYTHHQKSVIVDADAANKMRKIIAFVGGLDLCKGRYDTQNHSLFRTLQTVHKDDFHNPNYTGPAFGCPREPWHDLHCKIDGPAAYDVLTNFEERWLKASKQNEFQKMKASYDDSLLRIERMPDILGIAEAASQREGDPGGWHVQVFRSIDSNSAKGFPKDPKGAPSRNLMCGKNVLIDMSIHSAYVKAIRAAQHFIYIENQYFLGSSFNWANYKDLGANNLIPMEIALKVANKIRARESFSVYIVLPMWPEGVPTSTPTQRILFWQYNTMQMMYETIYRALVETGLEKEYEPQDYLNFFCLGNREAVDSGSKPEKSSNGSTPQALSQKNRRFMINVHSKGIIVDDEFVLIGSANINQRSLDGTMDTEIAMGAYQPHYTWATKHANPHGQIYGYRMSLWAEHMGTLEQCFEQPESLDCIRRIRQMGEQNWSQFAANETSEIRGHLLKYPVDVDRMGKVSPLTGCETFPDMGGKIIGTFSGIQENLTSIWVATLLAQLNSPFKRISQFYQTSRMSCAGEGKN